jgi:hypothetical protein
MAATGMGPGTLTVLRYQQAARVTKTEGGKSYFSSDYAYVPDASAPSTWKLRLTNTPGGKPDPHIVGAAVAALGKGFRGQKVQIPSSDLPAVKVKVRRAWKAANPDATPEEMPDVLKATQDQDGVSPPGWQHTVEQMKKHGSIDNPFALAWYMQKRGYTPQVSEASFQRDLTAALQELTGRHLPTLCLAAARGEAYAVTWGLNADRLYPERRS